MHFNFGGVSRPLTLLRQPVVNVPLNARQRRLVGVLKSRPPTSIASGQPWIFKLNSPRDAEFIAGLPEHRRRGRQQHLHRKIGIRDLLVAGSIGRLVSSAPRAAGVLCPTVAPAP